MDRRDLLKTLGAGAALPILGTPGSPPQDPPTPQGPPWTGPAGTETDPDLLRAKASWPGILTGPELATLTALCDVIIPADEKSPAASAVGVPDYINEWASAPYDYQRSALVTIRGGLIWLDGESNRRFGKPFTSLSDAEKAAICDDICYEPRAKPEFKAGAAFFDLIRNLTASGFYTTREGMKDLQYLGNVPSQRWDGPPPEVLKHLGLAE